MSFSRDRWTATDVVGVDDGALQVGTGGESRQVEGASILTARR